MKQEAERKPKSEKTDDNNLLSDPSNIDDFAEDGDDAEGRGSTAGNTAQQQDAAKSKKNTKKEADFFHFPRMISTPMKQYKTNVIGDQCYKCMNKP